MKIDGKQLANIILEELKIRVKKLQERNIIPHLAILIVGNNSASEVYVKQKKLTAEKIGIKTSLFQYLDSALTNDLLKRLNDLNHLNKIHGVIVQQPLPTHINIKKITHSIDPKKDVDGFHPNSHFKMPIGLAVLKILEEVCKRGETRQEGLPRARILAKSKEHWWNGRRSSPPQDGWLGKAWQDPEQLQWLQSKQIVIIGKGETGGKPIAKSLKRTGIKPIILDSKTKNPKALARNADIIISAVGKPQVVKPNMLKKDVVLVSVGLHKGQDGKLHGDYDEKQIKDIASFYTPTPRGVGPVNVAMLLKNLVSAAENLPSLV